MIADVPGSSHKDGRSHVETRFLRLVFAAAFPAVASVRTASASLATRKARKRSMFLRDGFALDIGHRANPFLESQTSPIGFGDAFGRWIV